MDSPLIFSLISLHCATSRKVAGSIPDGVNGIFNLHNPSGRTMILGLTRPLTEMSTRNISWRLKAAGAYGWQPYHLRVSIVLKYRSLNLLNPRGLSRPVMGLLFHFLSQFSASMLYTTDSRVIFLTASHSTQHCYSNFPGIIRVVSFIAQQWTQKF
jgi:hypothetical protein